jgi:molybdate transport system substrate-binding protein
MFSRIINTLILVAGIAAFIPGCAAAGGRDGVETLTVFAAASLVESFGELAEGFESSRDGVEVELHFAGSQTLRTQLLQGAAADVFAAADWRQMEQVNEGGLLGNTPVYFVANRMAVVTPADSRRVRSLADLADPGVTVALAAEEVPAGAYARQALVAMAADNQFTAGFADAVLANVVTNETSVRAVAQKVALGEVDAGLVYESDAAAEQYAGTLRQIKIPLHLNTAAQYPIATLAGAEYPEIALAFVEYVLSDAGLAVLRGHGFAPPTNVACPCGLVEPKSRRAAPVLAGG